MYLMLNELLTICSRLDHKCMESHTKGKNGDDIEKGKSLAYSEVIDTIQRVIREHFNDVNDKNHRSMSVLESIGKVRKEVVKEFEEVQK